MDVDGTITGGKEVAGDAGEGESYVFLDIVAPSNGNDVDKIVGEDDEDEEGDEKDKEEEVTDVGSEVGDMQRVQDGDVETEDKERGDDDDEKELNAVEAGNDEVGMELNLPSLQDDNDENLSSNNSSLVMPEDAQEFLPEWDRSSQACLPAPRLPPSLLSRSSSAATIPMPSKSKLIYNPMSMIKRKSAEKAGEDVNTSATTTTTTTTEF